MDWNYNDLEDFFEQNPIQDDVIDDYANVNVFEAPQQDEPPQAANAFVGPINNRQRTVYHNPVHVAQDFHDTPTIQPTRYTIISPRPNIVPTVPIVEVEVTTTTQLYQGGAPLNEYETDIGKIIRYTFSTSYRIARRRLFLQNGDEPEWVEEQQNIHHRTPELVKDVDVNRLSNMRDNRGNSYITPSGGIRKEGLRLLFELENQEAIGREREFIPQPGVDINDVNNDYYDYRDPILDRQPPPGQNVNAAANPPVGQRRVQTTLGSNIVIPRVGPQADIRRLGASPYVRIIISGLPVERNGELEIVDISSINVRLQRNDDATVVNRLYTALLSQFFREGFENLRQIDSEPQNIRVVALMSDMKVNYMFLFVNDIGGDNGVRNVTVEEAVMLNIPQDNIGRALGRRQELTVLRETRGYTAGLAGFNLGRINVPRQTRAQRGRYRGNVGAETGESIYKRMKARIFHKRQVADFFCYSRACISVPPRNTEVCFPMAFMRSQCRKVSVANGKVTNIEEDITIEIPFNENMIPTAPTSFWRDNTLVLFDNTKRKKRKEGSGGHTFYLNEATDISEAEVNRWEWCAIELHKAVCNFCEEDIDMNDLDDCLRAYSYCFNVIISVYSMEIKGQRVEMEVPDSQKGEVTEYFFVGLLLDGIHLNSISNMREYHKSEGQVHTVCAGNYCDFCDRICMKWNRSFNHQSECIHRDWMNTDSKDDSLRKLWNDRDSKKLYRILKNQEKDDMCFKCYRFREGENKCECETTDFHPCITALCNTCNRKCAPYHYNEHRCYMHARKSKDKIAEDRLFVYDIESIQCFDEKVHQYVHICNYVYMEAIYDDRSWEFTNIDDFSRFLISSPEMEGSTILAHNGGAYDHQFVLRYLEENSVKHVVTPRPNSLNKYLKIEIVKLEEKRNIQLIDFLMMFTASLKSIGEAFKLPVLKGDFPHKFSTLENQNYVGRLPPFDSDEDWYSTKQIKTKEALEEVSHYWHSQMDIYCTCEEECTCTKRKWCYKEELAKYCKLDVKVLKEACKAYRDRALAFSGESEYDWKTDGIEPFAYMTQSQIALALFMQGKAVNNIAITHEKIRTDFHPNQIHWMEELATNRNIHIHHVGNSHKERYDPYTQTFLDGYCQETKTAFEYMDCYLDGCYLCHQREIDEQEPHPTRNCTWDKVRQFTDERIAKLKMNMKYRKVEVRWSHEDKADWKNKRLGHVMKMRDFFYGGRTEVFAAYCDASKFPSKDILHHDVCSLYPYVCSWKDLPIGVPEIYFGKSVDKERLNPNHPDRYFGFARVYVKPNKRDFIAVLPVRKKGEDGDERLVYDLENKEGCWFTEMIYLAMEHQYEIGKVYEVWHYPKEQRSNELMRGYMEFFLRMKQESEGWSKLGKNVFPEFKKEDWDTLEQEKKDQIADYIYNQNGGFARPSIDKVQVNPVLRQLAKIFLNCLWGKLCQKSATENEMFIFGYKQYMEILCHFKIEQKSLKFRHLNGNVFKVRYKKLDTLTEKNPFLNIPIAAAVTGHAQVILMRQMFKIGPERILYCDTDSIMFLWDKAAERLNTSGLGNWELEHVGQTITHFLAIAPKCYDLVIKNGDHIEEELKCKGVTATQSNSEKVNFESLLRLLNQSFKGEVQDKIVADTMTIHSNSTNRLVPFGTLLTRYGTKELQIVFSKRKLLCREGDSEITDYGLVRLVPFGYIGKLKNR
jgi:hypothetical protein